MSRAEEYNSLRQEILQNRSNIKDYRMLAYTATTATLVFSCSDVAKNEPFISLLPVMLIIPLHFLCTKCYQSMAKLGAYICVFFTEYGFIWEKMTHEFEIEYTLKESKAVRRRFVNRESSFIMLIIICGLFSLYRCVTMNYSYTELVIRLVIIITVIVAALILVFSNHVYLEKQRTEYIKKWEELKRKKDKTQNGE